VTTNSVTVAATLSSARKNGENAAFDLTKITKSILA